MKTHAIFPLVALLAPCAAQETAYLEHCSHNEVQIYFPLAMVDASNVGKQVSITDLSISPAIQYKAVWISRTTLSIELLEEPQAQLIYTLKLPSIWQSLKGESVRMDKTLHPMGRRMSLIEGSRQASFEGDFLEHYHEIRFSDKEIKPQDFLSKTYYKIYRGTDDGKRELLRKVPAPMRPMRAAEALEHWGKINFSHWGEQIKKKQAQLRKMQPDDIAPHLWVAPPCIFLADDEVAELIAPEVGYRGSEEWKFQELTLAQIQAPWFPSKLKARQKKEGSYEVQLIFPTPILGSDAQELAKKISWQIASYQKGGTRNLPALIHEKGQYRGANNDFKLRLDKAASEKHRHLFKLGEGQEKQGFTRLIFTAEKEADALYMLGAQAEFSTITGKQLHVKCAQSPHSWCALVSPRAHLNTQAQINASQSEGASAIGIDYSGLRGAKATLIQLDPSTEQAINLIKSYKKYYEGGQKSGLEFLPIELLPNPLSTREIPLPDGKFDGKMELGKDAPRGLYFVHVEGQAAPDWQKAYSQSYKNSYITQALVQLSDIGLVWKRSPKQLLVYPYSMSTGKPLKGAKLQLLDAKGKVLASHALKAEGNIIELPQQKIHWLHLKQGADSYLSAAYDKDNKLGRNSNASDAQIEFAKIPRTWVDMFTDRPLYRPGETVHVKGHIRELLANNNLQLATDIKELTLLLNHWKLGQISSHKPELQKDGSFSCDIKLPDTYSESYHLHLHMPRKGDADGSSLDMRLLQQAKAKDERAPHTSHLEYLVELNRTHRIDIKVAEYKRNEFELKGEISPGKTTLSRKLDISAHQLNGMPLAGGIAQWSLQSYTSNFSPDAWPDYEFGDYRFKTLSGSYHYAPEQEQFAASKLNAKGYAQVEFHFKPSELPQRKRLYGQCEISSGNEQTLSHNYSGYVDTSELYVGVQCQILEEGKEIQLDYLLINTGEKLSTAPRELKLRVEHEGKPYQQRTINSQGGKGSSRIKFEQEGQHDIYLSGVDDKGQAFCTAITHWVSEPTSPPQDETELQTFYMSCEKELYDEGEPARLSFDAPFAGTALLSLERESILRSKLITLKKGKQTIEIPLLAGDAPRLQVQLSLIGQPESARGKNGLLPLAQGFGSIAIAPRQHELKVQLNTPSTSVLPRSSCEISGQVTDAQGKPLAGASVTLYAVDEGSLQAGLYSNPDLLSHFHSYRPHWVSAYYNLKQYLSETFNAEKYNNGARFIGKHPRFFYEHIYAHDSYKAQGFSAALGSSGSSESEPTLRNNFAPCALWLPLLSCDAEGRFSAQFSNPDTLTRYRVIALANAGAAQFGRAIGSYEVNQAIMLEPSAPQHATKGDVIDIPVTVSMQSDQLPPSYQGRNIRCKLQLQGNKAVEPEQEEHTLELHPNKPQSLTLRVRMKEAGPAQLTWRIMPTEPELAGYSDATSAQFTIQPATPHLREAFFQAIPAGGSCQVASLLKTDFNEQAQAELTLSPSPLSGALSSIAMLQNYPYPCSEQLASRLLPLLMAQTLHQGIGLALEDQATRDAQIRKLITQLREREYRSGHIANWPSGQSHHHFNSYVYLVLAKAQKYGYIAANDKKFNYSLQTLLTELFERKAMGQGGLNNPLSLLALQEAGLLKAEHLQKYIQLFDMEQYWSNQQGSISMPTEQKSRATHSPQVDYIFAITAQGLGMKQEAQKWALSASKLNAANDKLSLPRSTYLQMLYQLEQAPQSIAEPLRRQTQEFAASLHKNTYESAWLLLLLEGYLKASPLAPAHPLVLGKEISVQKPLIIEATPLQEMPEWSISRAPAYAFGVAEGYTRKAQPEQAISQGISISRRYEKRLANGTWQPTEELQVGDVVRVTLHVKGQRSSLAIIDSLPAGFEAINPAITGQAIDLPPHNHSQLASYKQYEAKRICIFVDQLPKNGIFEDHYYARVTQSGEITAPSAKVEMMYRPQVYGLSHPQKLRIRPRG